MERACSGFTINLFFADEAYNKQYRDEQRFGKLFIGFAAFAILISCLGLFGLSAFSITRRTREVGVRKVMGASVSGIVGLLSVDFIKLVLIAIFIASPIAWYGMNRWLLEFAYRIEISPWIFVLAGFDSTDHSDRHGKFSGDKSGFDESGKIASFRVNMTSVCLSCFLGTIIISVNANKLENHGR